MRKSNYLRGIVLFTLMVSFIPGGKVNAQNEQPSGPVYIVQAGDYLTDIAIRFGVSLDELIQINNIQDPSIIKPGDRLVIPGLEGITGVLVTETIQFGETLSSLSRGYGVPVDYLVRLNHLTSPSELYSGATLIIPEDSARSTFGRGSSLAPEESLMEYAILHGTNPWTLVKANNLGGIWEALPGDVLRTPGGAPEGPGALPVEVSSIEVNPLPMTQGKTAEVRISSEEEMSINGSFINRDLHFIKSKKGDFLALQGVHAMSEPGLYPLTIKGNLADGTPFGFAQLVRVRDGGYVYDLPLTVPEETIDPAVTKPEDTRWAALSKPVTMKRFWDGVFSMPTPLNKEYCLETNQCWSSRFGSRRSYNGSPYKYFHTGLDIVGGTGTDIFAPAAGRVVFAGPLTVRGNATMIDHGWGVFSAYMHQSEILVKVGDFVEAGQLIGRVGSTGRVEGPHLHWEIIVGGIQVDPMDWLTEVFP